MPNLKPWHAVLVLPVAGLAWLALRDPGPDRARDRFLGDLAARDWGRIVDQLPPPELANYPSKDAAKAFLTRVADRLPPDALADAEVRRLPPSPLKNVTQYEVRFPHLPKVVDGKDFANYFLLSALKGRDGWLVSLETLPVAMALQGPGSRTARLNRLADDLEAAGMSRYTMFPLRQHTSPQRLRMLARSNDASQSLFQAPGAP